MSPAITGLNHITLAVIDLERSIAFYRDILGCQLRAAWRDGAYLEAGNLWLCLAEDAQASSASRPDYTHIAFTVSPESYSDLRRLITENADTWKENRSEGDSTYFLDPDGHKLEIHVGSLRSRLAHYRSNPDKGVKVLD